MTNMRPENFTYVSTQTMQNAFPSAQPQVGLERKEVGPAGKSASVVACASKKPSPLRPQRGRR